MSQIRKNISSGQTDLISRTVDDSSVDWVCLKCSNLNFSFRSKCNRCKVQSREDNQQMIYADQYYYNQYYGYQVTEYRQNYGFFDNLAPSAESQSPQKKSQMSQSQLRTIEDNQLPSVSPLIKRYKAGKQKMNRKGKNSIFGWKLLEAQAWNEQNLPIINRADVQKELSLTDDQQASYQFAKSVQKMII